MIERSTVVITGSARGLGYEMAKCFYKKGYSVIISDIYKKDVDDAVLELSKEKSTGQVLGFVCDITKSKDIINLIAQVKKTFGRFDIWINNAGVNQPDKMIWELSDEEIEKMLNIDLVGTVKASKYAMEELVRQDYGAIYTVEGHGSNNAIIPGLSVYGTAKRGLTYFIKALAKEAETSKKDIIVGALSPGIMITDFLVNSFRDKKMTLSEKNKKIYNILGDKPDVVAKYLVNRMITNTNNGVRIKWLTNRKALFRFLTYSVYRRNFF